MRKTIKYKDVTIVKENHNMSFEDYFSNLIENFNNMQQNNNQQPQVQPVQTQPTQTVSNVHPSVVSKPGNNLPQNQVIQAKKPTQNSRPVQPQQPQIGK